jgi:type IV fimbrial biogenesis protein FimT
MRDAPVIGQPSPYIFSVHSSRVHSRGFTLIELMVVIIIAAILLTIAVPSFDSLIKRNNVDSLQSKLSSALSTARTEAASRNKIITICSSVNETNCTGGAWKDGWIIFEDNNGNGAWEAGDILIDVYRNSSRYTIASASGENISFNAQGFMASGSDRLLLICEPDKDAIYARGLFVNKSGLVMKTKDTDGDGKHNDPTSANAATPLACP